MTEPARRVVEVPCGCAGKHPACGNCLGTGVVHKPACRRCDGTGRTGGECVDCKGRGWRELDVHSVWD